jgi:hypothetical protein
VVGPRPAVRGVVPGSPLNQNFSPSQTISPFPQRSPSGMNQERRKIERIRREAILRALGQLPTGSN